MALGMGFLITKKKKKKAVLVTRKHATSRTAEVANPWKRFWK